MHKIHKILIFVMLILYITCTNTYASRIKDIVNVEGIRDNFLIGYGLVVGLDGTGDNVNSIGVTENSVTGYLQKFGVNTATQRGGSLNLKNSAAVMVTATMPPFSRSGNRIAIDISTLGDAKSIRGGALLATTLLGADGEVYAVAQGVVSIREQSDGDRQGGGRVRTPLTSGYIMNGAIIEREIDFDMNDMRVIKLALRNPDSTTARSVVNAINSEMRYNSAVADDPGTITVELPRNYNRGIVNFLADIENLDIDTNNVAKVIVDEATGTIVMGKNVTINKVAVTQNNLVIKVSPEDTFAAMLGDKQAEQQLVPSKPGTKMIIMDESVTLDDLVRGINALGVRPQDMIAILRAIYRAGALNAQLEFK